jgi:uncharacterized membrane protein
LIEIVYWLLLGGTLFRFSGELYRAGNHGGGVAWLVVMAGATQIIAILLYMWTMWSRIRSTTQYKTHGVSRESVGAESED